MQVMIPHPKASLTALAAALAALAGCGTSGNSAAVTAASASARPSTVASVSAGPSKPAKSPAPPPTTAAPTPRSAQAPSALLDSALSAMQAQTSVHVACTFSDPTGTYSQTESEDIGAASGRIVSSDGTVTISNLLVGGTDYISTNTAGVLAANGIPQAEAQKLAGEWISMRPGDSYGTGLLAYANGIHGLTWPARPTPCG